MLRELRLLFLYYFIKILFDVYCIICCAVISLLLLFEFVYFIIIFLWSPNLLIGLNFNLLAGWQLTRTETLICRLLAVNP